MARHSFTPEERLKAVKSRETNQKRKRNYVQRWNDSQAPDAVFLGYLLSVVQNDAESTTNRIRAAQTALPYVEQKLRARDADRGGEDPINLNEKMMETLTETHGDPWESKDGSTDGEARERE